MSYETSPLKAEAEKIFLTGQKPVHFYWTGNLLAGNRSLPLIKVLSIKINRYYDRDFSDEILCEAVVGLGEYDKLIYPNKTDLKISINGLPLSEINGETDYEGDFQISDYKAVLLPDRVEGLEGNMELSSDQETMDRMKLKVIQLQLLDPIVEQVRMLSTGGIFRNVVNAKLVRFLLEQTKKQVVSDVERAIRGVDVTEGHLLTVRDHVLIPHGTKLHAAPDFLQRHCGGVYASGLGYYLQSGLWYVYPQYDLTRFGSSRTALTVLNLPTSKQSGIERTYSVSGQTVVILATGETVVNDDREIMAQQSGHGARYSNAATLLDGAGEVSGNRMVVSRARNNAEFASEVRPSGLTMVDTAGPVITDNPTRATEQLAPRKGVVVQTVWQHSNPSLILPGMPLRYVYMRNDLVEERFGVVLQAQHSATLAGMGITAQRHRNATTLTLFIQPLEEG